jgi:predicted  nucleic acid-binding Zn-ribbon protein
MFVKRLRGTVNTIRNNNDINVMTENLHDINDELDKMTIKKKNLKDKIIGIKSEMKSLKKQGVPEEIIEEMGYLENIILNEKQIKKLNEHELSMNTIRQKIERDLDDVVHRELELKRQQELEEAQARRAVFQIVNQESRKDAENFIRPIKPRRRNRKGIHPRIKIYHLNK